ncbi:hypothetical protein [Clostridium guangxiense]|uniref:hypothetical protein n=1 Tax=Clostridium guangxiense TaxID=1662055 RepID=UPI001E4626E1|nr:hypothetical protein [Clostridium guangxiense]MCD2346872.1 hypothetical protein [Clostridium guangxiense]
MKKISSFIVVIMLCISIVGCSSSGTKNSSTKGTRVSTEDPDIASVVDGKVKAINNNKFDDYMDYYDNKSSIYDKVKSDKKIYFSDQYDMSTSVVKSTVLNRTKDKAQVQVEETNKVKENSKKEKGPGFLNNRILYVDYLKKIDGKWKITDEALLKTEYTDKIFDVLYKNIKAANDKKIDDYMSTFDSNDEDSYDKIKNDMLTSFNKYDVKYTLLEATRSTKKKSTDPNKDTVIYFEETCIDTKHSDYNNSKIVGYYHLRLVNGEWKIFNIETTKTVKVDAQGNEVKGK